QVVIRWRLGRTRTIRHCQQELGGAHVQRDLRGRFLLGLDPKARNRGISQVVFAADRFTGALVEAEHTKLSACLVGIVSLLTINEDQEWQVGRLGEHYSAVAHGSWAG